MKKKMYNRTEQQILETIKSIQKGMDQLNKVANQAKQGKGGKIIHDFELRRIWDELIYAENEIWDKVQDKS